MREGVGPNIVGALVHDGLQSVQALVQFGVGAAEQEHGVLHGQCVLFEQAVDPPKPPGVGDVVADDVVTHEARMLFAGSVWAVFGRCRRAMRARGLGQCRPEQSARWRVRAVRG